MAQGSSRKGIGRLIYGAGGASADMLYATGFKTPDPYLWFSVGQRSGMVVNPLEVGRARQTVSREIEVFAHQDACRLWCRRRKGKGPEHLIAGLSRHFDVDRWRVPAAFPVGLARRLEKLGVAVEPLAVFFQSRRCKSEEEVARIREGIELVESAMRRAFEILGAGRVDGQGRVCWRRRTLTAEALQGEINAMIASMGGSSTHTIAAPGVQGAEPHLVGQGPIRANEPIVIDVFPCVNRTGYHGDLTRTVVKGRASRRVKAAFKAVREARDAAIAEVRAGVGTRTVHRAAAAVLRRGGFETRRNARRPYGFIHGVGHGVGLQVHEPPVLGRDTTGVLEIGDVITIEPGLYYPEWGGVRIEDIVVVRKGGCENLTTIPTFLEIS